jgi:single-stranded DNA-specific DHH superfamily exonuclease
MGKGSCRSVRGFSLIKGLERLRGALEVQRHDMAAGLSVRRTQFDAFKKAVGSFAKTALIEDLVPMVHPGR